MRHHVLYVICFGSQCSTRCADRQAKRAKRRGQRSQWSTTRGIWHQRRLSALLLLTGVGGGWWMDIIFFNRELKNVMHLKTDTQKANTVAVQPKQMQVQDTVFQRARPENVWSSAKEQAGVAVEPMTLRNLSVWLQVSLRQTLSAWKQVCLSIYQSRFSSDPRWPYRQGRLLIKGYIHSRRAVLQNGTSAFCSVLNLIDHFRGARMQKCHFCYFGGILGVNGTAQ